MMNKFLISLTVTLFAANLSAQQTAKIVDGFNIDEFPKVSFIYHSNNPEKLNTSDFWLLKESGENKDFEVEHLPALCNELPQTTIILWENMAHNGIGQFKFTKQVLSGFFNTIDYDKADKFAIYGFNRRKNNSTSLINITDGFTNNKSEITTSIQTYRHSTEHYREFPNRSDMYTAIRESMELLSPIEGAKAIIVFTSGYTMKNSGSDSESQVLLKSQQIHIPVYIFQYYYRSGVAAESEGFAKSTYGMFNSYMDVKPAQSALIELYPKLRERYQGHNYQITFTTDAERGAESRMITLSVGGQEIQEQLLPPPHTIESWITANLWLVIILASVLLILIICAILFVYKTRKDAKNHKQELIDLENRRLQDLAKNEQALRDQEQKANSEREKILTRQHIIEEEKRHEIEVDQLNQLMRLKNIYPRLKYSIGYDSFSYEITKAETSIGREQDNDLVISNSTVSRHHAKIVFNGTAFEIIDNKSTNKVIVNGQFVKCMTLKSGDKIGLGEVVITFLH